MSKLRDPLSIHDATRKAHAALGDAGVRAVTGKTESLVQKWSDPDLDGHHVPLYQAIALDVAMVEGGKHPPHFEAFRVALEDAMPQMPAPIPKPPPSLSEQTLGLARELGEVAAAVAAAQEDGKVTAAEKRRIARQLDELLDVARAMQRGLR
jgi:hypothetical protein